jgi:hypothetical protein
MITQNTREVMRVVVQMIMQGKPEWKELIGEQDHLGSLHVANLAEQTNIAMPNGFLAWLNLTNQKTAVMVTA